MTLFGACKYQAKCAVHVVEKACVPCTLRDVDMMHFIYDSHDAACAQCFVVYVLKDNAHIK